MANPGYVRSSDGNDADNGSTWALANATLAGGFADGAAGDRIYLSDNHAESTAAAVTLTSPGTAALPCQIICGDDSVEPPTSLATTAAIAVTGSNALTFAGFTYYYGVTFNVGTGSSSSSSTINFTGAAAPYWNRFERCSFIQATTSVSARITMNTGATSTLDDQRLEFIDCDFAFGSASQMIVPHGWILFEGGSIGATGVVPTVLFGLTSARFPLVVFRAVDLSALGSGHSLVDVSVASSSGFFKFENCKFGSSVEITTGAHVGQGGITVLIVNCDSADTNYRYAKHCYQGIITNEQTIVRTGGASDGTTGFSRKMVSSANSKFYSPLVFGDVEEPLLVWNETTGSSVTATVEIITDNVTLTDAEAWIEVEYMGTGGFPLSTFVSDRASNILSTPANQTTSSETWTTTGLSTPVKQKLSVSFTPQEKGWIRIRVMLAKASTTMYFCPKVDLS